MNVVLFGATGMIGQAALRECLLDPQVTRVLSIVRRPTGQTHAKLREIPHEDFLDFSSIEGELSGADTCLWALGVASAGLSEEVYRRVTHDFTLAAAEALCRLNPTMTFVFISGVGADSTERGRIMWARVKGMTENALLRMPFKAVYVIRPGFIQPLHGIQSRTTLYRVIYRLTSPLLYVLKRTFPDSLTTTEQLGRAMIRAGLHGAPKHLLTTPDINRL